MNPNLVRAGQFWRDPTGRIVEVLFVEPVNLNAGAKIRNVDTGKITWAQAWRISAYWRLRERAA